MFLYQGEVVTSPDRPEEHSYRVDDQIGEGRCCIVYSAHSIRNDAVQVALKVYRVGQNYEGALQREMYMMELLRDKKHNIVNCFGTFVHRGLNVQVMELLDSNIRQLIFKNDRTGLSPWIVQKFAKDILASLHGLHSCGFVHADLKPGNVMWSSVDGCFKVLDFSLTFHKEDSELHQIQTKGYQAPEAAEWNTYKEELKKRRKRKLQGTYTDLTKVAPAFKDSLNQVALFEHEDGFAVKESAELMVQNTAVGTMPMTTKERWPSESSGVFTASELSQCTSPSGEQATNKNSTSDLSHCSDNTPKHSTANVSQDRFGDGLVLGNPSSPCAIPAYATYSRRRHSVIQTTAAMAMADSGAEWRKAGAGGCRGRMKAATQRSPTMTAVVPPAPPMPKEKIDIWSFGCLLFEILTGTKLFRSGDKLVSVLRPLQLVEMRIGESEVRYSDKGNADAFVLIKDLITGCLREDVDERLSIVQALEHPLLKRDLMPEEGDLELLPTKIIMIMEGVLGSRIARLGHGVDDDDEERGDENFEEVLMGLREEASKFGHVSEIRSHGNHVYLEFSEVSAALRAFDEVDTAVFYPTSLWNSGVWWRKTKCDETKTTSAD